MPKKLLVLVLVAMLVLPATALAVGKPDSVVDKSKGKAFGKNHSRDRAEAIADDVEGKQTRAQIEAKRAKGEAKKAKKKALKAQTKADKKFSVEDTGMAEDSTTTVHRGKGILNAMSKLQRNIERAGEKTPMALKMVVNKFASWLGLDPVYDDEGNL
ncbi:MAG: hypothetical protein IBX64_05295 [Actinobacteria bacterium]|nr:hypothetical protein [Actinomycetota bacterium]